MGFRNDLRSNISALFASFRMRLTTITRYPGQLVMDILIPIVFAYMPILLGRASGSNSTLVFAANTGTANYITYMLIGSSVFTLVNFAFWHVAYWLLGAGSRYARSVVPGADPPLVGGWRHSLV
jgi:hypothetical protein